MKTILALVLIILPCAQAQFSKPKPAFAGQTEAPAPSKASAFTVEHVAGRLTNPWSLAFLPDGNFLVTESYGTIRIVRPDGVVSAPIQGVPGVKGTR